MHHVTLAGSPRTILTNTLAETTFTLILSATYFATTTTEFLQVAPLLQLVMSAWLKHDAEPPTTLALDWHIPPFGAKQGITTRESNQLIYGLYRFKKSMPKITSFYKPSSTYTFDWTTTWRSPPSAVNFRFNSRTSVHNYLFPLATVTVNTAPSDGLAPVDLTTRGCTKLWVAPLSNIQFNDTPSHSATN